MKHQKAALPGRPRLSPVAVIATLGLVAAFISGCAESKTQPQSTDCAAEIHAPAGIFTGINGREPGVCRYLGIPFAKPPLGALRFAPPQPLTPMDGVFKADKLAHDCLQKLALDNTRQVAVQTPLAGDEDCLYLNVFGPADQGSKSTPKPVMFWIFGGAFVVGGSSWDLYEGSRLAAEGVIVVTVNYRLGPLGFFAHSDLTAETKGTAEDGTLGNQGILDQRAGLQWVHDNIAAFGGDPNNVTIFGESAGGMSVCSQIASPLSRGLFHKAIIESAGCKWVSSPELAMAHAATWVEQGGCQGAAEGELSCLRQQDGEALMNDLRFDSVGAAIQPTLDGVVLNAAPLDIIRAGSGANVPLLAGANADEVRITSLLLQPILQLKDMPWYDFHQKLQQAFPITLATQLPPRYGPQQYDNPYDAWNALQSDWLITCPAQLATLANRVYQPATWHYSFQWTFPGFYGSEIGTSHAMELFFVFGTLDPFAALIVDPQETAAAERLSACMRKTWTTFARTGNPDNYLIPHWTDAAQGTLVFSHSPTFSNAFRRAECALLDPYLPTGLQNGSQVLFDFAAALQ